ncbi:MAG: hypothetical protein ACYTFG_03410 [Planctomycetota bacterium]|jgi:hypothetical protein
MSEDPVNPGGDGPSRVASIDALRTALARARRRKALSDALEGTAAFAVTLPLIAAGLIMALKYFDPPGAAVLTPIAVGTAALVGLALGGRVLFSFRGPSASNRVAWEIDRRLGLREAFTTSVEIAGASETNFFGRALLKKTAQQLDGARIRAAFPVPWFRPAWFTSALLLVAVLFLPSLLDESTIHREFEKPSVSSARTDATDPDPGSEQGRAPAPGGSQAAPKSDRTPAPSPAKPTPEAPPTPSPVAPQPQGGDGDGHGGSTPPMLGDPERSPAEFEDVAVKPFFGPKGKTRMVEIEVPLPRIKGNQKGPGKGKDPTEQITKLLTRYEKRAEHALSSGRIGRGDRKTVLKYFERVREMLKGK